MILRLIFFIFLQLMVTQQAFLNKNRVNITSNFTLYYRFTDDNLIYLTFSASNNNGWVAMAFKNSQTSADVIQAYMNGEQAVAQDMWSTADFTWVLDSTLTAGTDDVSLDSGSRSNGVLNITVYRALSTGDQYDYTIINSTTVKCLFFWSTTDDKTTKYSNTPSPLNVYFTSTQICESTCAAKQMTCIGPDSTDCICPQATYYDSNSGSCLNCLGNCSVCTNASSCTTCSANHYLQANPLQCTLCTDGNQYKDSGSETCTICDANCQSCASDINCGNCNSGYFLTTSNKCSACIANCTNCTSSSDCQACMDGYLFSNSKCVACPQNCKTCSDTNTCTQCMPNYYFQGSTCVACDSLGQLPSGLSDGTGTCSSCVQNCKVCSSTTSCTQCGDGFTATSSSQCDACTVTSCKTCSSLNTCTTCLSGFTLYLNTCQKCSVANCNGCDSSGKCISCAVGYLVFNGICTNCTIQNCAYCNSNDPNTCVYCADSYYLQSDGTCAAGTVQDCAVPWGQTSCVGCQSGFLLQGSSCYECSGRNCLTCSSNNICSSCNTQYFLTSNLCSKCGTNCNTCSNSNTCLTCSSGYYLDNSQCSKCGVANCQSCPTSSNKCDSCLTGYFRSSDQLTCSACTDTNCTTCSSASVCTACNSGYYLNSGSCVPCVQANCASCSSASKCDQCLDGYTANLAQTTCSYCPYVSCQRCDADFQCAACTSQFYFNSTYNSCISCKSNCLNCQDSSNCTQCTSGFYLSNNECLNCPSNCAQCNQTNCISCATGYGLNSIGQCITCQIANCQSCESNNVCSQCASGFTLNTSSNTCGCSAAQILNQTSQTCLTCSNLFTNCYSCNMSVCLNCLSGYYSPNNDGNCIKCNQDNNCGVCSNTNCLSCISGYYLSNNTCTSCFVDCANCTGSSNSQCTSCNTGFYLLSSSNQCATSNCPSSQTNCQSCVRDNAGNLQCVSCITGYYLNADTGTCDSCHPTCLTCSGKSSSSCSSCPSYSIYYKDLGLCQYNCSQNCLTCNGNLNTNCLSCSTSFILLNGQCVSNDVAFQNISNFVASNVQISPSMVDYAAAVRSFTQKTASVLTSCSNNTECFDQGECYEGKCLCNSGFVGQQCQISQTDLTLAITKKNEILAYLVSTLSSLSVDSLNSSNSTSRLLQNSSNSTNTQVINSTVLALTLAAVAEVSTPIELWTTASSINTTIFFLNQILRSNLQIFNQTIMTYAIQTLSNMVFILNNYNTASFVIDRAIETMLYQNISITIQILLNTTLSSLTAVGNTYRIYTPYLKISLNYADLSVSQSPKFTLYSSSYYATNDVYMSQVSFTADSTSLITKINGGSSKIILKQCTWISANPYPENREEQVNLTLATGIAAVEIFRTNGDYLPISGITDYVAIRIKKIVSSAPLDTETGTRYACAYWVNSSLLWEVDGIDNDRTTDSQNYLGCYTNHLTAFTVVYRNKTDFFALEYVETQLSYVRSNYGFIACILIILFSILLVPAIAFTKSEQTGFTKRSRPVVYHNVHELEKNLGEPDEKHEINLNTFQSYEKVDDKKHTDSLNYWMFYPFYAIVFSEGPQISVQKYTIFLINLQVFLAVLSFCFADYTVPDLRDKAVFAGFSFCAILVSWFSNYIYGFWAWSMRKKDNLRVNILYWPIFFIIWIVLGIFISWRMAYVETEYSNYWLLSIAICLVFDMFLFDLFIVVVAKEAGSNPKHLQNMSKFFRLRGYYD